jgi:HTTM domain
LTNSVKPNPLTLPQPIERLEFVRFVAPLAILGFLSSRLIYVPHWLTEVGFVVPEHPLGDYRQPLYIPPIPVWLAVLVALATVASGVATSVGYRTRWASGIFAALLAYLALADRLEAFTVNKLGTAIAIALFASPCGARYGIDARVRERGNPSGPAPTHVTWGNVRFFQALLMFMYLGSGIAKLRGGWLGDPHVIWSHLHDSYQTAFTYFMARTVPAFGWTAFQYVTLAYEVGAPLWFALPRTRVPAMFVGLGMHATIGVMFGPVIWFSLLMSILLLSCFAPLPWLIRALNRVWRESATPALSH